VWAIEDCRHVSRRLEQALITAGERVVRVPPQRMGASRRGERESGKSDQIDALAIARAVVKDGVESFPAAYLDQQATEIRLLSDHRRGLVAEPTRVQNRLRWHLLELSRSSPCSGGARLRSRASSPGSTGACAACPPAPSRASRSPACAR
jgi:transposase